MGDQDWVRFYYCCNCSITRNILYIAVSASSSINFTFLSWDGVEILVELMNI